VTRPEVLLFDLFGTLVFFDDSRIPTTEFGGRPVPVTVPGLAGLLDELVPGAEPLAFLRELRRVGAEVIEEKRRAGIELHTSVRFERALRGLGAEEAAIAPAARRMAALHMDTLARAVVCPPSRPALLERLAASHRLALLSNFDDGATARRVLDEAGLTRWLEVIVVSEEEGIRKPSREIFARACARLSASPADCLYIGDTRVEDIEGATGAGLPALWIRADGGGVEDSPALAALGDVDALPGWLDEGGFSARGGASR
jgi:FMN phosphatase YigB (HAD superfamily)